MLSNTAVAKTTAKKPIVKSYVAEYEAKAGELAEAAKAKTLAAEAVVKEAEAVKAREIKAAMAEMIKTPLSTVLAGDPMDADVGKYLSNKYGQILDTLDVLRGAIHKIDRSLYRPPHTNDYVKIIVKAFTSSGLVGVLSIRIDDNGPFCKGRRYVDDPETFLFMLEEDVFNLFNSGVRTVVREVPVEA